MSKTTTRDMTDGNILRQLIVFALPLFLGNVFQLFYNTVDTVVVGKYVGKVALAAVGSTTMITNMVVFFFNGLSIGAGVVISRYFGAKDLKRLHEAIETTAFLTIAFSVFFTIAGVVFVRPLLVFMSTPEDVMNDAGLYLRTYMAGISGLLIYNMASGILRAVGDTTRPLYFLIFTSVVNVALDLLFVIVFKMGIFGVTLATIIAQFLSAILVIRLLVVTHDIYKLTMNDLRINKDILREIFRVGLPTAIQATITSFSNVFVQSYINYFGSSVMAGWSCYNKLDQFIFLPMGSMANSATTFVSQNIGAKKEKRANEGTVAAAGIAFFVTLIAATLLYIFSVPANRIFTKDQEVIEYGSLFIRVSVFFLLANSVNHTLAGAIRGRGDSAGPMAIMLLAYVLIRQIYLFVFTKYISNTPTVVALSYPVGWVIGCTLMVLYYFLIAKKRKIKM